MTILLTGATGFLGTQVLRELTSRNIDVHAFSRRPPTEQTPRVTWHRVDMIADDVLPDAAAIGASHCLHLAWEATPGSYRDAPANADWVPATVRLARGFFAGGGRSFVMAGSCAEYGIPIEVCDERRTALAPDCAYALGKVEAAQHVAALARDAGARFASARIFFPYGPGGPPEKVVAKICRGLARGEPVALGSGEDVLDYIYHTDVARGLVALALSDVAGPVNIGSGEGVAVRDLALRLGALAGRPELLRFGEVTFGRPTVRIVAAIERLTTEVGYRPTVTLEAGLRACYEAAQP